MQSQKNIIVYYGDTQAMDKQLAGEKYKEGQAEIFVVEEHHKEEVPAEYYDNPEEYYRLKFKQRGYEVTLRTYKV